MIKLLKFIFLLVGAMSMLLMSRHHFQAEESGILVGKAIAASFGYRFLFLTHVSMGIVAISLGPFQFLPNLLKKRPKWHRMLGYVYAVGVLLSSISGFGVAPYAMGGIASQSGFSVLALLWFFTALKAVHLARIGQIGAHRYWMYLNYGLTFAAITQRTMLLIPLWTDVPFMPVYRLSAWLPWILNLGLAHYLSLKPSVLGKDVLPKGKEIARK